jgi:hypothetical protein
MADFSPYLDLDDEAVRLGGKLPLSWVRSGRDRVGNFGDSLSAVVVAAITRRRVMPSGFQADTPRLAAIGTIGQNMRRGTVHFWGTGVDPKLRAFGNQKAAFALAPETSYVVHATRGAYTRQLLLENGLHAPPIYGDPGWFLPRILNPQVEKTIELGVIPHISGLVGNSPDAKPHANRTRLQISGQDGVQIIPTYHEASWDGFQDKLKQILSCKRIVSTSFHGLILADAYRIPCLYFPPQGAGPVELGLEDGYAGVDHRVADFYRGAGRRKLAAFGQPTDKATAWDKVMAAVDSLYQPLEHPGAATLLEAFPFRRKYSFDDATWPVTDAEMNDLPW